MVLPGSSVRGALRTRASRIARTVLVGALGQELEDWSDPTVGVHDQLASDPSLVRDLFGTTEHRGALTVLDTVTRRVRKNPRRVTHNAGDRWTGGAAEGALYGEELWDQAWEPIVIELDSKRLLSTGAHSPERSLDRAKAAWCLLGLVLAELATGTLPLGSRGTRGLGQVEVSKIRISGIDWLGTEDGRGGREFRKRSDSPASGQAVARDLLTWLQEVNASITDNEAGGVTDITGWSTYLVESVKEDADA
nr:RAMP superfamily CRISPR-associated protein [Actinomyces ruminis]